MGTPAEVPVPRKRRSIELTLDMIGANQD